MDINQHVYLFIFLFVFLNLINTYFLTKEKLNRYIAPCKQTFSGEITSILGNVAILVIFVLVGYLISLNEYNLLMYLVIVSLILNLMCIILSVYNQYYGNSFSKAGLEIFKNPAGGIIKGLPLEFIKELIFYYRIVLFLPSTTLLIYLLKLDSNALQNQPSDLGVYAYILLFVCIIILIIQKMIFERLFVQGLAIMSVKTTYCIQNLGVYPYYLSPFSVFSYHKKIEKILHINNQEDLYKHYDAINKNKMTYFNAIDQQTYSNNLILDNVAKGIQVDPSLLVNHSLQGALKNRKLVLVQVESFNHFLLQLEQLKEEHPFLDKFLNECLVLDEFYTSVGIGVSSDAEVSTLTGMYPSGTSNLYWQNFNLSTQTYSKVAHLTTLPKYFKLADYYACAIHGDQGRFYNRKQAYDKLLGFEYFHTLEDFENKVIAKVTPTMTLYASEYLRRKHLSPWVNDYELAKYVSSNLKTAKKKMIFAVTMMPHTPFEFNPEPDRIAFPLFNGLNAVTERYLNFTYYYDNFIKRYFIDENNQNITDTNAVYLFYGDHGSGLKNDDLEQLLKTKLSNEQERKHLLHVNCFMYVPSQQLNQEGLYTGLIKGHQSLVRGQIDIYRTMIELFDLPRHKDFYMGVHLLSNEPTYVIDNKLLDIVTDKGIFSMRNPKKRYPQHYTIEDSLYQHIRTTKLLNDLVYKDAYLQAKINQYLNQEEK